MNERLADLWATGAQCCVVVAGWPRVLLPSGRITDLRHETITVRSDYPEQDPREWEIRLDAIVGVITGGQF